MVDQYTTTENQDAITAAYGTDLDKVITEYCGKCGGKGRIAYYAHVDAGICYDCDGYGGRTDRTVKDLLRLAKNRDSAASTRARKAAKQAASLDAWKLEHADLIARGAKVGITWWDNWTKAPSETAAQAALKAITEREGWAAKEADRKANATPIPEGRTEVVGKIIGWKFVPDNFSYAGGDILKITVEDDRGFRLYGTCPESLKVQAYYRWMSTLKDADEQKNYGSQFYLDAKLKGSRVSFSATLEASKDDSSFGFYKRPTKAVLI